MQADKVVIIIMLEYPEAQCASVRNVPLSPESRYIPYFLLFSFILRAVGLILAFSPFIL
jgi:hypothetical protein